MSAVPQRPACELDMVARLPNLIEIFPELDDVGNLSVAAWGGKAVVNTFHTHIAATPDSTNADDLKKNLINHSYTCLLKEWMKCGEVGGKHFDWFGYST